MSEFYFDYKCIAMNSTNTGLKGTDKALNFYLFQDYNNNKGSMCIQVYVPKSMQAKYCGARLYSLSNGIDFPDFNTATEYDFIPCGTAAGMGTESYNISDDNCIFIKSKNGELSGSGIIAFIDGNNRNAVPKVENAYKYVINYSKKETISYRILEHKNKINIQIIYPLIRSDIILHVIEKTNAKPVLIRDRMGTSNLLMTKNGPATITLKANGRAEDVVKVSFPAEDIDKTDFRLVFEDLTNNKYYILVDESDYTFEDKSSRIDEQKNKHKLDKTIRKCPYCGEAMGELPKFSRNTSQICTCDGKVLLTTDSNTREKVDPKLAYKQTIVCKANLPELSNPNFKKGASNSDEGGFIPVRNLIIPNAYMTLPSMNVVVCGAPKSGKTIYLSSLFNMRDGGTSKGVYSSPFILDRILNVFDKTSREEKSAQEVKFENVEIVKNEANEVKEINLGYRCEQRRSSSIEKIKKRYVISVGDKVESYTDPSEAFRLSWHPIGFQMGNLGFIYFYDVPGEKFSRDNPDKVRSIDMADCFLAVIDGANDRGAKDALHDLDHALGRIKEMSTINIDMKNIPIAIVFTKHDLKLTDYVREGDQEGLKGCFDENCHVVREDMLDLMPRNGVYAGSELERHIDCSSYELEHFLKSAGDSESASLLNNIKMNYKNIKFFTCSALGNNECLEKADDDTKEVLFRPRRLRMELPIIWLMYQKGLIKG